MNYISSFVIAVFVFIGGAFPALAEVIEKPKLYRLDCGDIHVSDLNVFSDTDRYVGQQKTLVDSCYLINVGSNWLLWDTGLPTEIVEKGEEGVVNAPFHLKAIKTLTEQLDMIGLMPEDITHVAISHGHFDHVGNVNMFKNAKLVIQKAEYDILNGPKEVAEKYHMRPDLVSNFLGEKNKGKVMFLEGDKDLFEDGRVTAISLPGHTPGHMALKINLVTSGVVILSGDQWHFNENRINSGVPSFNWNRADTMGSSDRLNRLVKNNNAKLIIQHEPADVAVIPALPAFLD